jgi:hypothetical protein
VTWIRVDTTLIRHPKIARFAKSLGTSRHEAVGILIDLWTWVVDYAEGGDLSRISGDDLMTALGVSQGDALIQVDLIDALVTCGLVDRDGESLVLHDWDMHQGQLLAQRDAHRERQRRYRQKKKEEDHHVRVTDHHVPVTVPSRDAPTVRDDTKRHDTRRTKPEADASLLTFGDLLPVTPAHVDRWRPLFPNLDIAVELEAMHAYLVAAPANRRPKRSLAKFAINWLKRSAKEGKSSEVGDQRGASNLASQIKQNEDARQKVAATKPVSKKSMEQAKAEIAQLFGPSHRERRMSRAISERSGDS